MELEAEEAHARVAAPGEGLRGAIAVSVLENSELAIIPGLYGVWMLFTGFGFAFLTKEGSLTPDPVVAPR